MELATARLGVALRRLGQPPTLPRAAPSPSARLARVITLYEYEASPYCKRVREAVCALGLSVRIKPCPRTTLLREGEVGTRWRAEARALTPPEQPLRFPLLHDEPALGSSGEPAIVPESLACVAHLWTHYGDSGAGLAEVQGWVERVRSRAERVRPFVPGGRTTRLRNFVNLVSDEDLPGLFAASVARPFGHAGLAAAAAARTAQPDVFHDSERALWADEACPHARLVREALCSLGLSYTLHGMGGAGRGDHESTATAAAQAQAAALRAAHGEDARPPFLVDPRLGVHSCAGEHAVRGLWKVYHGGPLPALLHLFSRE
ncbi:hypothetical protein T492DRAFT_996082 [Pavlovales sp. CCMP2436]|nr:hypothetical protein T492DRAFT_996082 [Pavlovales sp. CCMP2436]